MRTRITDSRGLSALTELLVVCGALLLVGGSLAGCLVEQGAEGEGEGEGEVAEGEGEGEGEGDGGICRLGEEQACVCPRGEILRQTCVALPDGASR
ncbi:MAG: hypothetical protein RBU45_25990, partial [Myxococcota bacterium]|nr:hypothetical protein [Myxococcota bacterium]